eukprot:gene4976-6064_t
MTTGKVVGMATAPEVTVTDTAMVLVEVVHDTSALTAVKFALSHRHLVRSLNFVDAVFRAPLSSLPLAVLTRLPSEAAQRLLHFVNPTLLPFLHSHGLRAVSFDFVGAGLSGKPQNGNYDDAALANIVLAICRELRLPPVHLVPP